MTRYRSSRAATGGGPREEDEERTLWNQFRSEAKRVDEMVAASNERWDRMCDLEAEINARAARGVSPSSSIEDELGDVAREHIKLLDDIRVATEGDDDSSFSILHSLEVLSALRGSSEAEAAPLGPRAAVLASSAAGLPPRDRKRGNSKMPGSPLVSSARTEPRSVSRASSRHSGGRNGSTAPNSAKTEDGTDPASSRLHDVYQKIPLVPGTEVLYRLNSSPKGGQRSASGAGGADKGDDPASTDRDPAVLLLDGEGILCSITTCLGGDGKNRRFEIQDSDPDPSTPPHPYKATMSQLVPIPPGNDNLPFIEHGTPVLALYPGTTTFYKAEVVVPGAQGSKSHRDRTSGPLVRLRFEGEDEADKEEEVERRHVIPELR